ncbi:MAG: hypothetical protein P4L53_03945 [Candidatus Obscuribacterales bacterium]|nr:hypothetical protein [Candidatus Obscuribacterales bacterium]
MRYIKVKWKHDFEDEPIWLYSELDDARFETRKVEIFNNGECGFDDGKESKLNTRLGIVSVPELIEIAQDAEFVPYDITKEEFEVLWINRFHRQDLLTRVEMPG